jgi:hypothetical protein
MTNETRALHELQQQAHLCKSIKETIIWHFMITLVLPMDEDYTDGFAISVVKAA